MQDLSKAMDLYEEPCVGWLQPFERWEEPVSRPEKKTSEAPDVYKRQWEECTGRIMFPMAYTTMCVK